MVNGSLQKYGPFHGVNAIFSTDTINCLIQLFQSLVVSIVKQIHLAGFSPIPYPLSVNPQMAQRRFLVP